MPLFSEHISNMYYSGTPSYSSVPYAYSGSPYGTSYSASYLNPGGNYSNHSSLAPYTRTLSSRWLGRNYSPILSTISEKGTTSPVRINSPRRTPVSRTYNSHISIPTTSYTARPININTADIDVSRDKYRNKSDAAQCINTGSPRWSPSTSKNKESTSEVCEKPNMGVDSSPGSPPKRSTIKRDRPVVRLHTIKRKDRDSPRQLVHSSLEENSRNIVEDSTKASLKWRERLADDLAYKNKKEKKTIGEMLVEKFTLKDKGDLEIITSEIPDESSKELDDVTSLVEITIDKHKLTNRRCSMEQLAEQASLLDSLIRRENLSTATLDLSKIGSEIDKKSEEFLEQRKRKFVDQPNPLTTTKSEHCLPTKPTVKRKSLRKSMSGENIRKLDRISELPQIHNKNLPCDETKTLSIKRNSKIIKSKPKLKQKITASVDVSTPPSPLKFVIENVTVEEKILNKKKDIVYSSSIDDSNKLEDPKNLPTQVIVSGHRKSVKRKIKPKVQLSSSEVVSPEPEDGNFWDKIGKRETVYLIQRKKELDEASEQNKRSIFWFPEEEEEEVELNKNKKTSNEIESDNETATVTDVLESEQSMDIKSNEIKELKEENTLICNNKKTTKGKENIDNIDELSFNKESNIYQYEKNNVTVRQEKDNSPSEVSNISHIDRKPRELKFQKSDPKATVPEATLHATSENTQTDTGNIINDSPCENILNKFKADKLDTFNISINNVTEVLSKQEEIPAITSLENEFTKSEHTLEDHKDTSSLTKQNCDNGQAICRTEPEINDDDCDNKSHFKNDKKEYEELQIHKENNTEVKFDLDIPSVGKRSSVIIKNKDIKTELEESKPLKQASVKKPILNVDVNQLFANRKPVKDVPALRPLIATPRPLQKKAPQIVHSSSSSETSSSEESSEEEEDETSESSSDSCVCENNVDGRTSTGSNDSGFDSSAPASPSGFSYVRKEQSTAYDLFKKTGRFTPPARSIPRFRKYTIDDFHFIKVLGKGSFGKVMLAELRDTEYYYAVKCLKKDVVLEDDDVECTLIERKVLALGTNHPYLCHLFATFQTDSHLFFVMEYLNGGDLMFHIQQSGRFPEPRARFYAAEIVSGLKFLHKRGIVYRDLKLDNILLDFEGHVRIADFGMCKLQIYLDKTADTFCGTPDYMAPEIIKGLKYNQTVDWWSFGVLLYEMLIGQSPFSGCDEDELFWSICNEMPSYPRFLSADSLAILTRLLDKDACTRLGGAECVHGDIRDQPFFHDVPWDRLERRALPAPFKPRVRHPLDTQYFDRAFTGERPRLTAVEPHVLRSMDQGPFHGFSYTNPNATDR